MKARLMTLAVTLLLSCAFLGCNKNTSSDNTTPPPDTTASSAPTPQDQKAARREERREERKEAKAEQPPPPPPPLVIPTGTTLTISLGSAVGSKISQNGQNFSGTLANSVQVDGATAIPAGAPVSGVVVDAKPLGRFAGGASLTLKLTSVSINGVDTAIETSAVSQTEKGKGKRTGIMAGGGAGLGAIVGALAGGGKGAAIGALAGAGAGTAGAAFTGNKEIVLPAESAVSFKLEQSITVQRQ